MNISAIRSGSWLCLAGWRRVRLASAMAVAAGVLATVGAAPAGAAIKTLTVKTTSLPAATAGVSYQAHLAASGGIGPYTWSVTQGSLPAGLTLVPTTGLIAGIPSAGATASFTVQVSDSENPPASASANLSITVTVEPLTVTTTSLPAGTADVWYSAKLAASGGIRPRTWSITQGALPAGLSLDSVTGAISGTPTALGTASFTVNVSDAENPPASASANLSITVSGAPLVITTAADLPTATAGTPYSTRLAASGGLTPYAWSITGGSLPAGLKLHATTGVISGTPASGGTSTFTAQVSDAENPSATAVVTFSLGVKSTPLQVTTTTLAGATAGQQYSADLAASGGIPPYTWSVTSGSLPSGLSLDPATGAISGTPASTGASTFTVSVTDSANPAAVATATLSIIVTAPPLTITTTTLPNVDGGGQLYSVPLGASGGVPPYTWSITSGSLPAGLSLDPATGLISGTSPAPTSLTTSYFTVTVTDSDNPAVTATANLSITLIPPLTVTTTALPAATVGQPYSVTLTATGGVPPYTWYVEELPPGLSLDAATGTISGTLTQAGNYRVDVIVADSMQPVDNVVDTGFNLQVSS